MKLNKFPLLLVGLTAFGCNDPEVEDPENEIIYPDKQEQDDDDDDVTPSPVEDDYVADRPNIVVFFIDDLRPEIDCFDRYGVNTKSVTPNIDALAEQGVQFNRAYAQQALSAPSRMSILSGLRPENIGIYGLFTSFRSVHPTVETLPQFFNKNDYKTIALGKVFHHDSDDEDVWSTFKPRLDKTNVLPQYIASSSNPPYECVEAEDNEYQDGITADNAIAQLKAYKDDPFVMFVGLTKPHLPFCAPKKYWDMYDRSDFIVPFRGSPLNSSPQLTFSTWGELRMYEGMPSESEAAFCDDETTLKLIHGYHACVSYMDAQVGKVMAELERLNLRENTTVILIGDHGWKLGEYGAWCKHSNSELDLQVPLIISRETAYKAAPRSVESWQFVESVDLFPTMTDICGLKLTGKDGESLTPLLKNPNQHFRDAAYSLYGRGSNMGFTCTDGAYRYVEWWSVGNKKVIFRELYPCKPDYTKQTINLANLPAYADIQAKMKTLLDRRFPESERSDYPQNDK